VIVSLSPTSCAGSVGQANHSASRAGVAAMTVTLARKLARYDIRERIVSQIPLGCTVSTEDISHALRFVLECDNVSGSVIEVDGVLRPFCTHASRSSDSHMPGAEERSPAPEQPRRSLMTRMRILVEEAGVETSAVLNDSVTAAALWRALPLESPIKTWGAEVYFTVPVECVAEDPQATVNTGAVGYWPPGSALCLFFGQQPVSPVNLVGVMEGDSGVLQAVHDGQTVRLERVEE
jgi:uncharacterized protein